MEGIIDLQWCARDKYIDCADVQAPKEAMLGKFLTVNLGRQLLPPLKYTGRYALMHSLIGLQYSCYTLLQVLEWCTVTVRYSSWST